MKIEISKTIIIPLLCLCLILCFAIWFVSKQVIKPDFADGQNATYGAYLSQEEVFKRIAVQLIEENILSKTQLISENNTFELSLTDLRVEEFNTFTNNQYGGMYLDDNKHLVVCFIEEGNIITQLKAKEEENNDSVFFKRSNQLMLDSIIIKPVQYSYVELLATYEDICDYMNNKSFHSCWIDEKENAIGIGIFPGSEGRKLKQELRSTYDDKMLYFTKSDPEDRLRLV